jgi:acetyl-CoA acetyltransferase family protein
MQTEDGRIEEDESIRRDLSPDKLAQFPPVLQGNGTVTAGNAPHLGDGAAATLITSRTFAADHDLDVLAAIGSHTVAGVNPTMAGTGPIPAVRGLLKRTGYTIEDYDLIELNEAFASQALHCQRELGIDDERLNTNGGAIAIGHALGACGARLAVTLVHEMKRREVERGLVTMSVGFGQGMAIELERKSA